MSEADDNDIQHERPAEEPFTGVYQPRRGPLARVIAALILLLLIVVPILLALVTIGRWDPPPDAPPRFESHNANPDS